MEHFDWNHLLQIVFTVVAAYFGGHAGGSNGASK